MLECNRGDESGVWSLESGVWSLESGVWSRESGVWSLESGGRRGVARLGARCQGEAWRSQGEQLEGCAGVPLDDVVLPAEATAGTRLLQARRAFAMTVTPTPCLHGIASGAARLRNDGDADALPARDCFRRCAPSQ